MWNGLQMYCCSLLFADILSVVYAYLNFQRDVSQGMVYRFIAPQQLLIENLLLKLHSHPVSRLCLGMSSSHHPCVRHDMVNITQEYKRSAINFFICSIE